MPFKKKRKCLGKFQDNGQEGTFVHSWVLPMKQKQNHSRLPIEFSNEKTSQCFGVDI